MDIARTPATPDGNPLMADAAVEPKAPTLIRAKDHKPFAWHVPQVELEFALGLAATTVRAALTVERNQQAEPSNTLRLNGDGIAPLEVLVDGVPVQATSREDDTVIDAPVAPSWRMDGGDLLLELIGERHQVEIVTRLDPSANSQLSGLYASNAMLCTQCEAEGFRRITFFPDRPDVLSTYDVRLTGDRSLFPVLLSNGDMVASGERADGTHWAQWRDPWPKPSYLFALVAGDLVARRDRFTTMGGREVELAIWVREGDLERTGHAMESLTKAMAWDEETFGREYDLATFNIVAVSDFNMGAMENKGLNIFNTRYVLADRETATDGDYDAIEGVIAHEYLHNWSGNRVTCRDWFQLSLKEGFTVLRDQLFSQDAGSAPVKRIEDVRVLRGVQFPEDSGPLAHPVRPASYSEISNFYTATIYNKGAEVIRMMRTLAGPAAFRAGCDLYFSRHDGEAATCEDFVKAIEEGAGLDLTLFRRWYDQAGTPRVSVRMEHANERVTLHLAQNVPPTPGQADMRPMVIPLVTALIDRAGGKHAGEQLLVLEDEETSVTFDGFAEPPVLSINRGFSAPVIIERDIPRADLLFLAVRDDDPFARYEAMQELVARHLIAAVAGALAEGERAAAREAIGEAMAAALADDALDDLMRGELMILPAEVVLAERIDMADPAAIHAERQALRAWLGDALRPALEAAHERVGAVPFSLDAEARGARKVKTQALSLLAAGDEAKGAARADAQYGAADNMTDRQGALMVLAGLEVAQRTHRLIDFYQRYRGNALVIDKWFAIQAGSLHPRALAHVEALADHADFTLANPNRVRSLYMAFAGNPHAFHDASGEGYRMIADLVLRLDPVNPQTAARFVPPLGRWRRIEPRRADLMRGELERIADAPGLSRDTYEQVSRSLG